MAWIEALLLAATAAYLFYRWATALYGVFDERGVPYDKPLPMIGNSLDVVSGRGSMFKTLLDLYKRTKTHKVYGYFNLRRPIFVINDPELIKQVMVKDFENFPNHAAFFNTKNDKLLESMLSVMKDQRWKDMRNTLSPVFTAAKMRTMFSLMNECFEESIQYLHSQSQPKGQPFELEMKQCFTRLSNDLIASTAFGLKTNSYSNTDNEFYRIGQSITSLRGKQMFKMMLSQVAPWLMNLLGLTLFDKATTDYFTRLVVDAMRYREEHNIVRPDMIQLLMEAKKESPHHWSDEELVAQCFIFFFAAFENNANFVCTTCHELLLNPDVQQRLFEEASEVRAQLKGAALSYDDLNKMKYLDQVVSESLRKWALAVLTDRVCTKDYTLRDGEGHVVVELKAGDSVWFPLVGLQRDEQYFESPEVFDPDRFSEENKSKIPPFTYLPFGGGPRICIGNRYALMQAKAMLYYLVLEFKLEPSPQTTPNLLDEMRGFQVNPKNGFWAKFVPRQ